MDLKLYNTLTRTKEVFRPIDPDNVRMYVCGPTVYDFAHIGNARPVIVFDVLFRLLRHLYGADRVTYVRNITDVDDKINARARRDHPELPLNEAIRAVTEKTAGQYHADVKALGCLDPTHEPRATEHIAGMVAMIQQLIDKGHAYVAVGGEGREVLFAVDTDPDYGTLSKRRLEDQQAGARVAVEAHKRNPADFVLWKESSGDLPGWEGTFTEAGATHRIHGRPGWHIECSVMSKAFLGETFDIHGGGLDLIFPHHENEIAQSCCAHDTPRMANVWMHNGYLQVEGRKMSKSEGNFVTIHDLLETETFGGRRWPGEVLRLAMLMTHYREPIDFSVRRLEEAEATLENWRDAMANVRLSFQEGNRDYYAGFDVPSALVEGLTDDLNVSKAIAALHTFAKGRDISDGHNLLAGMLFLGLTDFDQMRRWESYQEDTAVSDYMNLGMLQKCIDERLAYIADKNWAEADRIRDELLAQGIQLKDSKDSVTGERVTTWELKR